LALHWILDTLSQRLLANSTSLHRAVAQRPTDFHEPQAQAQETLHGLRMLVETGRKTCVSGRALAYVSIPGAQRRDKAQSRALVREGCFMHAASCTACCDRAFARSCALDILFPNTSQRVPVYARAHRMGWRTGGPTAGWQGPARLAASPAGTGPRRRPLFPLCAPPPRPAAAAAEPPRWPHRISWP